MSSPRALFAAAVSENQVYALGGAPTAPLYSYGVNAATDTVETFSACTQAWLPSRPMPRVRAYHAAARGGDGRVYVIAGYTDRAGRALDGSEEDADPFPTDVIGIRETAAVDAYTPDPATNPCPKVSIDDVTVTEPSSGTSPARFTVTLDRPAVQPVRVAYETADGSAKEGSDYRFTSGTLEFGVGETTVEASSSARASSRVRPSLALRVSRRRALWVSGSARFRWRPRGLTGRGTPPTCRLPSAAARCRRPGWRGRQRQPC